MEDGESCMGASGFQRNSMARPFVSSARPFVICQQRTWFCQQRTWFCQFDHGFTPGFRGSHERTTPSDGRDMLVLLIYSFNQYIFTLKHKL
jgi:hypothetical protein